ncbi:MAG: hypothetical protein ACLSAH_23115 [Bilophila wadsworthia]
MLLAFEVVLFGGLAFMFFCILRNQDSMLKTMREEHGAILSTLAKLEKRIATLQQLEANIAINPLAVQPPCPRKRSRNYPKRGTALPSPPRNRPLPRRRAWTALFPQLFRRQSPKGRFA